MAVVVVVVVVVVVIFHLIELGNGDALPSYRLFICVCVCVCVCGFGRVIDGRPSPPPSVDATLNYALISLSFRILLAPHFSAIIGRSFAYRLSITGPLTPGGVQILKAADG